MVKGSKTSAPVAAVASTATVGSSSMSSSSAPVPMFKPHRTKGEILTEIVSDMITDLWFYGQIAMVNKSSSIVDRNSLFCVCLSFVLFPALFFFLLVHILDAFGTKELDRNSVGSNERRNLCDCTRYAK